MEDAERFPAWAAWSALSDDERRVVWRLAKQGREHPDVRVADAARRWAEVLVLDDVWRDDRWWRRAAAVPGLLLSGDGGITEWLEHRAEQPWTRRVLAARRREG